MKKCPYCFEEIKAKEKPLKCPTCGQFIIDDLLDISYSTVDDAKCTFCGKAVAREARICKHCHKWLDDLDNEVERYEE